MQFGSRSHPINQQERPGVDLRDHLKDLQVDFGPVLRLDRKKMICPHLESRHQLYLTNIR